MLMVEVPKTQYKNYLELLQLGLLYVYFKYYFLNKSFTEEISRKR